MNCESVLLLSLLVTATSTQRNATATSELQMSSHWRKNGTVLSNFTSVALYSPSKYLCVGNQSIQCPSWAYCDKRDGTCKCSRKSTDAIICDPEENHGFILSCYCLTHNQVMDTTDIGICLYNCDYVGKNKYKFNINVDISLLPYNKSSLDYAMCGKYNRTGILCGKCINNTYLQTYSYDMSCISCRNSFSNWIKYFIVAYVPLTLFCIAVMMLRINIPSSQIQGFVLFSQILSSPNFVRVALIYLGESRNSVFFKMIQLFGTLYGIWNLDFFRLLTLNICFEVSPLTVLSLDFFVAVYPLLLIILTLLYDSNFKPVVKISKPFKAIFSLFVRNWDIKTSTIDAFATFIFLSNVKFLSVCFDLLVPVQVCDTSGNGSCKWAVFYDAMVPYLSHVHLPYAVLAMFVLLLLVIGPILILIIYPFLVCQKCLVLIPRRWQLALHAFVDSIQGSYKDGTGPGTRDCRWFSAVPFLVRFIIFSVYGAVVLSPFIIYSIMILVFTATLIILVDPYKPQFKHYSNHLIVFILFLACTITCAEGLNYSSSVIALFFVVACIIGLLHLLYISILILNWIISHRKFGHIQIK